MSSNLLTETEARLNAHEEVCALRYQGINSRLKRLESILLGSAGSLIVMMAAIIAKMN